MCSTGSNRARIEENKQGDEVAEEKVNESVLEGNEKIFESTKEKESLNDETVSEELSLVSTEGESNENVTETEKEIVPEGAKMKPEVIEENVEQIRSKNRNSSSTSNKRTIEQLSAELNDKLICPICHSLFNIPVTINPCQHTFCSECIRTSMRFSRQKIQRAVCPVCRVNTDEREIKPSPSIQKLVQLHLEKEKKVKVAPEEKSPKVKLQKKPPAYYHNIKRKRLVQMCAVVGLNTSGKDEELKERHLLFTTLYNAECDSLTPRSHSQILVDVEKRENERRRAKFKHKDDIYMKQLKTLKKDDNGNVLAPRSGNSAFDAKLNSNFKKMIHSYRENREKNEGNVPSCIRQLEGVVSDKKPDEKVKTANTPKIREPEEKVNTVSTPKTKKPKMSFTTDKKVTNTPGPWDCPRCTFSNRLKIWSGARCEMCNFKRGHSNMLVTIDLT